MKEKETDILRGAMLTTFRRRSRLITALFVVVLAIGIALMGYFSITKNYELLLGIEIENVQADIKNVANILDEELTLLENISLQYTGYYEEGLRDLEGIGNDMGMLFDGPCGVALLHENRIKQKYAVNIQDNVFSTHMESILQHINESTDAPGKQVYFFSESYGSKLDWLEFVRSVPLKNGEQLIFVYKIENDHTWTNFASETFEEYSDRFYIYDIDTSDIVPKQILMVDLSQVRQQLSLGNDQGILIFDEDNDHRMVAFQQSAKYPYYVFNSIPYLSMQEYIDLVESRQILLSVICILAIMAIVLLFKVIMLNPVVEIESAINRIVLGEGENPLKLSSKNLFYPVSRTINAMLQMIKQMTNREYRERLLKKQAELSMLQSQINPHFLHNTFESIRALANKVGAKDVSNMTLALANFFRYSQDQKANLVPLREELKNIENYLIIQNYRFKNRFKYTKDFDENSELMDCLLNKMTLQPIVENAVFHGLEPQIGSGEIIIRIMATAKRLLISVRDNGIGISMQKLEELNQKLLFQAENMDEYAESEPEALSKGGIALINVDQRIKLSFGKEYGLVVYSKEGFGTNVEITLPLVTTSERTGKVILPQEE